MQDCIKPRKRDFDPSLHLLHVDTNDLSLEDTPEAISKRIIATAESLKKEHNEIGISNIVVHGDDLKEKGKTLSNILIEGCKRKSIPIINHWNINPLRNLNRSRLHFNSCGRSIFVKDIRKCMNNLSVSNCQRITDNLSSIASSPFLNDTSCLGLSNLFEQSANDLANMKNQRLRDPNNAIIGHFNINSFRNKYEMFAGYFEKFNIFLISESNWTIPFQKSNSIYTVLRFSDVTVTGTIATSHPGLI